jgi:hypothetical protein
LFTYLAPNLVDNWPNLEQKFHEYFYNDEVELRLSDLTTIRQKYNETVLNTCEGLERPGINVTI